MKRNDVFERYAGTGLPACILSLDFHILSRNESALALSRKFRIGSNFGACLEKADKQRLSKLYQQGEVSVLGLSLPNEEDISSMFIPAEWEEQPCFLVVCFPRQLLSDLPSRLSDALRPSVQSGCASDAESEMAAEFFTKTFRRSYALGLSAEERKEIFLIRHACAFLNRFSDRSLLQKGMEIEAFCTNDNQNLPLYNFPRFTALLVGICLFCILCSENAKVKALFYTVTERAAVQLSFFPAERASNEGPVLPTLFETPLKLLSFDATTEKQPNGRIVIDIICQKAMPIGSILTPEDEQIVQNLLEILLYNLLS